MQQWPNERTHALSRLERVLAEKIHQHPELVRNPTWAELLRVLEREGIRLVHGAAGVPARLIGFLGSITIIVDSGAPKARWNYFVLHELCHLWLHVDPTGRDEVCFAYGYDTTDARENEAEDLVSMIMNRECWK